MTLALLSATRKRLWGKRRKRGEVEKGRTLFYTNMAIGEAREEMLVFVGPRRWVKPLTGAEWP